jgi:hypothetical protein
MSRSSRADVSASAVTPTNITSPMIDEAGARIGSIRSGSAACAEATRSAITWRAAKGSVSHSKSTQISEMPMPEDERIRRTSRAPLTACSSGSVTRRSTSSGARPSASVTIVTVGAASSGSTSTGITSAERAPKNRSSAASPSTSQR